MLDQVVLFLVRGGAWNGLVWIEALVCAALALWIYRKRPVLPRWPGLEAAWNALVQRPRLSLLLVFLLPIVLRVFLLIWIPPPAPMVHDEFGNLLLADTFAEGRLSNPPHPFWKHFETYHVLQQPRYFSYRPPAPGLFLAPFWKFTGSAWAGVCFSTGLMCAALLWMLQAWLPARWALLGGLLAAIQIGVLSYWMNSYWGGEWAALGGALVMGGLGRWRKVPSRSALLWLMLGAGIVVNTRQLEGGLLVLVAGVYLVSSFWKHWRLFIPAAALGFAILGGMLYYNYDLTGSPLTLPYRLGLDQYKVTPSLAWEKPIATKHYNHEAMRRYLVDFEMGEYAKWKNAPWLATLLIRLADSFQFFVRPALGLALLALPWIFRHDRRLRPLLWMSGIMFAQSIASVWFNPHYIAPATGAFYAILIQGLRRLRTWSQPMATLIPAVCALTFVLAGLTDIALDRPQWWFRGWSGRFWELPERVEIAERLNALPGEHLLLIRYQPDHNDHQEWVYNRANIDASKVVWAREMSAPENQALIGYYAQRRVWLLEPDVKPPRLTPYAAPLQPADNSQNGAHDTAPIGVAGLGRDAHQQVRQ